MMPMQCDVDEDLDTHRRLHLVSAEKRSGSIVQHTVRKIRNSIDELSDPSRDDKVLFAEAENSRRSAKISTAVSG